jgi:type IV pilus assembly protein PilV
MVSRSTSLRAAAQAGASMIEVLVTMVIIAFGLLGMAGLQARMQVSEMESYQRSQALLLLNDMANRIAVNRNSAALYVTGTAALGSGMTCPTANTTTVQQDLRQWCEALQGAAELSSSDSKVGAMIGGRGCVENASGDYLVTVVWQGFTPISAPPASVACGLNAFNGDAGSSCTNDRCRRAVTTLVRVATL